MNSAEIEISDIVNKTSNTSSRLIYSKLKNVALRSNNSSLIKLDSLYYLAGEILQKKDFRATQYLKENRTEEKRS